MCIRDRANAYANAMGATFTDSPKPLEVELLVAEVAEDDVELYHILYDGSITDEENYVAIGGSAEAINEALKNRFEPGMDRATALRTTVAALQEVEEREMVADRLEVAGLDRALGRRKFFRLSEADIVGMLS